LFMEPPNRGWGWVMTTPDPPVPGKKRPSRVTSRPGMVTVSVIKEAFSNQLSAVSKDEQPGRLFHI
jgi:hypothetical protein